MANNILWVGCILMVLYFRESAKMEAAYGFSITIAMLMTTYLLCYFLFYRLKWSGVLVLAIGVLFFMVESSFFIANIAKIKKQRWMFLFFEASIFTVMYCWFYARKVKNRLTKFVEIGSFAHTLRKLHADIDIPKCATHTVSDRPMRGKRWKIDRAIHFRAPIRSGQMYWLCILTEQMLHPELRCGGIGRAHLDQSEYIYRFSCATAGSGTRIIVKMIHKRSKSICLSLLLLNIRRSAILLLASLLKDSC
ncbi:MAG: KUP/HAK/KT family potassium transporter [Chitinophagales bacterium]